MGVLYTCLLKVTLSHSFQIIGKFLLDAAAGDPELWVIAESLDCIFDVFGEDDTDKVAHDIGLVDKLRGLAPSLKNKASAIKF